MKRIFDMYYIINNEEDLNKQRLGKKRRDYLISLLGKYSLGIDSEYETAIKGLFSVHDAEDSGIGWVRQVCEDYKQEIEEEINHIRRC